MKFEAPKFEERHNPNIPQDVNNLREFRALLGYLLVTVAIAWLLIEGLIWTAPRIISLERERQWLADLGKVLVSDKHSRQDKKMQALADALAEHMQLPKNSVSVYIGSETIPNAFATFGGNVLIYQGLLDKLEYEESVAAVLAHEIAHIKHRDPLRAMSRGLFYTVIAASFGSEAHLELLANLEGMRYSRALERAADEAAMHALAAHYGHIGGIENLFTTINAIERQMKNGTDSDLSLTWLKTHPDTESRLAELRGLAVKYHYRRADPQLPNLWMKK